MAPPLSLSVVVCYSMHNCYNFSLSLSLLQHSQKGSALGRPPLREFAHWECEERTGTVGRTSTATPAFPPQHPNTKNHNPPRNLSMRPGVQLLSPGDGQWGPPLLFTLGCLCALSLETTVLAHNMCLQVHRLSSKTRLQLYTRGQKTEVRAAPVKNHSS